jgi:hypothetical protein
LNVTVVTIGSLAHNDNEQMRKFNHFSFRDEHDEHVSLLGSTCIRDMDCVLGRKEPDNDGCTLRPNRVAFGHPRLKAALSGHCARALARRKMGRANACRVLIGCLRIGRIMKHRLLPPATLRARSKR